MKTVALSGATGLVGAALSPLLQSDGFRVIPIVRGAGNQDAIRMDASAGTLEHQKLEGVQAVVHLAGENIAGRWSAAKKKAIRDSRVIGTRLLCENLARLQRRPAVLACASAVGIYGDRGDERLSEESAAGTGFLAGVCREWEAETQRASDAGIRVVNLRIGVVLSRNGGALKEMLLPFKFGIGGVFGSGKQYWSWIALEDVTAAIRHVLLNDAVRGPVNLTAPAPVTNYTFTKTLGAVLGRPTILPVPAFAARLALGEMAQELLLTSTRAEPQRLLESGYAFQFPTLAPALRHALG